MIQQILLKELKILCKNAKLKNFSKYNKEKLIHEYNKYLAVRVIQKYYRKHLYRDAVDHITLESVKFPCFIFKSKNNTLYFYEFSSIIKFIMKTGNTYDPMTRIQYTDEDLSRLDSQVKLYFPEIKYKSTLKIKKNLGYARRIVNRENEIINYELRLSELKICILTAIDSNIFIFNETFIIDNEIYRSPHLYLYTLLNELKMVLENFKLLNEHYTLLFINNIKEELSTRNMENVSRYNLLKLNKILC